MQNISYYENAIEALLTSKEFASLAGKTQLVNNPVDNPDLELSIEELVARRDSGQAFTHTRGTHTLDVAFISRRIAEGIKALGGKVCPELAELAALGHDVGHTPFGHDGERIIENILKRKMAISSEQQKLQYKSNREKAFGLNYEGQQSKSEFRFDHNEHSVEVMRVIMKRNGLKLDDGVRDAILSHSTSRVKNKPHALESQIVRLADKIAYINRDIDDLRQNGLVNDEDIEDYFEKRKQVLIEGNPELGKDSIIEKVNEEKKSFIQFMNMPSNQRIQAAIDETIAEYQRTKEESGIGSVGGLTKEEQNRYKIYFDEKKGMIPGQKIIPDVEKRILDYPVMSLAFFSKAIVDRKIELNQVRVYKESIEENVGALFDYYEPHFSEIPQSFQKEWEGYSKHQIVAYYISTFNNSECIRDAYKKGINGDKRNSVVEEQKKDKGIFNINDIKSIRAPAVDEVKAIEAVKRERMKELRGIGMRAEEQRE